MSPALQLPADLARGIMDRALATPDVEICGLLGGRAGRVLSDYPVVNAAGEPALGYLMEPRGQLDAFKQMRGRGEDLLGIYHSHPDTGAELSATDRALAAYPGVHYLVVSVLDRRKPVVKGYFFDGRDFLPAALTQD